MIKDKKQTIRSFDAAGSSIVLYLTKEGGAELQVKLDRETVWLTQRQMAELFGTKRPAITKHLLNIFKNGELNEKSVCSILEHTAADGKTYRTQFYNLDAIISVGYRVNSRRATQFRIWATRVLKDYLVQGYAVNQKRLTEETQKLNELQKVISFVKGKAAHPELQSQAHELLSILGEYAGSLTLLHQYDEGTLAVLKGKKPRYVLSYENCKVLIEQAKNKLMEKGEAGPLLGQEINHKFKGVLGAIYQTFDRKDLYPSIEEKAANLLYLTIKDHPFSDGNKRIGSLLFVYFLDKNNYLQKANGERKITDTTLVALALLVANSDAKEKDVMIKIITNLLKT